jgi:predicted ATP-binding protein involved in virulence
MLTTIKIEKLFNTFDYTIELKPGGITILTGPNGYGKTTVLRILDSLAKRDIQSFIQLPFKKISLEFSDAKPIIFTKKEGNIHINSEQQEINEQQYRGDRNKILHRIELHDTPLRRLDKERWIDLRSKEVFTEDELFQKILLKDKLFQEFIPNMQGLLAKHPSLRHPNIPKIYFIREQRLLTAERNRFKNTIEVYATDLISKIKDTLATSSKITQELDSSFPRRLFEQKTSISENEFNERFDKVKGVQKTLSNYGFSEFREDNHPAYREEDARALAVYIEDTEKKLAVLAELLEKLNLFTEILNECRFTFKQIRVSKDAGFTLSTDDGKSLLPQDLSSGEQQEVVMLYELLFRVQPNTLVLIDEPELSLHVVWQQEFLNDLEKIVAWQKIQVIIATHSPQIINERWDLVVDLWDLHHAKPTE